MTAQIPDTYLFEKKKYEFIAKNKPKVFDPRDYGLKPHASSTGCWRGHWCDYAIKKNRLILKKLHIYNAEGYYPPLKGIEPSLPEPHDTSDLWVNEGHVTYKVDLEMDYSGSVVIGRGFMNKYYTHGGYQRAWAFEEVKEIIFEKGNVLEVKDHSEEVKDIRKLYNKNPVKFLDDLVYDLSYDDTPAFLKDESRPRSDKLWPWWLIP